jgi:hypothetical protein
LAVRNEDDLQRAHKNYNDLLLSLRKSQNLEDRLDKLQKHKKEIEVDAVGLESEEGLPIDHVFRLAPPFVLGSVMLFLGLGRFFGWQVTGSNAAKTVGRTISTARKTSRIPT